MPTDNGIADRDMQSLEVTAQWALQGKLPHDAGYRLLNSSRAMLNEDNFSRLLERYSLGTLEQLPQIAVTWIEDKAPAHGQHGRQRPTSYLGVAIHARPATSIVDVGGRDVVQTSFYCVEYDLLAASAVSYSAMYEGFRKIQLPTEHRDCVKATLATHGARTPVRPLATFVAAMLLTDKPVCVLGADDVDVHERLQFIDDVAALLPYGMRSRLSAATWTSSTNRAHNFRLFFSSKARNSDDHKIPWNITQWPISTGHMVPDRYMSWLTSDVAARIETLATMTGHMGFGRNSVIPVLTNLGVLPGSRQWPSGGAAPQAPTAPPEPATWQADAPTVESLLLACVTDLKNANPVAAARHIQRLADYGWHDLAPDERERCREIVTTHRLLRENLGITTTARAALYQALLRLVFSQPIMYDTYRSIETCVDEDDDWPIHAALGEAIEAVGASKPVRILARQAVGADTDPKALAEMLALPNLLEHHAQFILAIGLDYLEKRSKDFQREEFRAAFQARGYLADVLRRIYLNDANLELRALTRILQLIYGRTLSQAAVDDILRYLEGAGSEPTAALCAATTVLADRDVDIRDVIRSACDAFVKERRFNQDDEAAVIIRLNQVMPRRSFAGPTTKSTRRLLSWWPRNGLTLIGFFVALLIILVVFARIFHR